LPVVPVPLLPGDADVTLDLQQALTNVYDLLGYDLAIDYSGPPELSLPLRSSRLGREVHTRYKPNALSPLTESMVNREAKCALP
jgi:hypothetical protein